MLKENTSALQTPGKYHYHYHIVITAIMWLSLAILFTTLDI